MPKFGFGADIPLVVDAVDPGRMKTMALLLADPNPIHWDVTVNERLGLGPARVTRGRSTSTT
jgi:hypothetical protein